MKDEAEHCIHLANISSAEIISLVADALRELTERHDNLWKMDRKIIADLKAERDAAYVRGLERAVEIARNHFKGYDIEWWRILTKNEIYAAGNRDIADAIQAEIDKAGKP